MLWDLGLPGKDMENNELVEKKIKVDQEERGRKIFFKGFGESV